jgi:hypothetical protein
MLRRKKRPWHEPVDADPIDGVFVNPAAEPDLADMDRFHRAVANDELAEMLTQLALLDPDQSAPRH